MTTTGGQRAHLLASLLLALVCLQLQLEQTQAGSLGSAPAGDQASAVIPSPNQADLEAPEEAYESLGADDIPRRPAGLATSAANEAAVPVYASPFARSQGAPVASQSQHPNPSASLSRRPPAGANFEHQDESSHAPPNYAPRPQPAASSSDLKTSASYGHHQHGYGHHDHTSGWLDMGAWTGGKGSFGWYADYPVGGKHHGYGRR